MGQYWEAPIVGRLALEANCAHAFLLQVGELHYHNRTTAEKEARDTGQIFAASDRYLYVPDYTTEAASACMVITSMYQLSAAHIEDYVTHSHAPGGQAPANLQVPEEVPRIGLHAQEADRPNSTSQFRTGRLWAPRLRVLPERSGFFPRRNTSSRSDAGSPVPSLKLLFVC